MGEARKLYLHAGHAVVALRVGSLEDLAAVGTMVLLNAARLFDPASGCAFSSYAVAAIRHALWRALDQRAGDLPNLYSTAAADGTEFDLADDQAREPIETVNAAERAAAVNAALQHLTARQSEVIHRRFFHGEGHTAIAEDFGVSRERIRQLEAAALKKLGSLLAG